MHRDKHPSYVEGCYTCKLLTVGISASATPSRSGPVVAKLESDRRFDRDGAAYKRLRKEGLQPDRIDGCGDVEIGADTVAEIEAVRVVKTKEGRKQLGALV